MESARAQGRLNLFIFGGIKAVLPRSGLLEPVIAADAKQQRRFSENPWGARFHAVAPLNLSLELVLNVIC
jgi:hypothetical protein